MELLLQQAPSSSLGPSLLSAGKKGRVSARGSSTLSASASEGARLVLQTLLLLLLLSVSSDTAGSPWLETRWSTFSGGNQALAG